MKKTAYSSHVCEAQRCYVTQRCRITTLESGTAQLLTHMQTTYSSISILNLHSACTGPHAMDDPPNGERASDMGLHCIGTIASTYSCTVSDTLLLFVLRLVESLCRPSPASVAPRVVADGARRALLALSLALWSLLTADIMYICVTCVWRLRASNIACRLPQSCHGLASHLQKRYDCHAGLITRIMHLRDRSYRV